MHLKKQCTVIVNIFAQDPVICMSLIATQVTQVVYSYLSTLKEILVESISFVKKKSNYLKYSLFQPSLCPFVQVAKFPFEEVPASKQGAKQEPCPSSAVPISAPSAHVSAGVLDIDTKTGSFIDYIYCIEIMYSSVL